jgi:hypothetical protein
VLCHELCHHLDYQKCGFRDSWHTRGFYERTAALDHHHAQGTPPKRLLWAGGGGLEIRELPLEVFCLCAVNHTIAKTPE